MDAIVTAALNGPAGRFALLDSFIIAITQFGVPLLVILVALQWWDRGDRSHVRHVVATAGLSFVSGLAANQAILQFVHRVRPYDAGVTYLIIAPSTDPSFPSDHATAVAAIVAAFVWQGLPFRTTILFFIALLVAWSRIYVGAHYASDVLGGMLTGIVAAIIVRLLYREGSRLDKFVTGIL